MTFQRFIVLAAFALALLPAGCVPSSIQECENGKLCPPGTECSVDGMACITPGGCDNAIVSATEECDDGNTDNTDGCTNRCVAAIPCTGGDSRSVDPVTGACYMFFTTPRSYVEAWRECHALVPTAFLASVQSFAENERIRALTEPMNTLLGGTDAMVEGMFLWDDNTPVLSSFVNWADHEPNNGAIIGGPPENCMVMLGSLIGSLIGKWNDVPCAPPGLPFFPGRYPFVCERD